VRLTQEGDALVASQNLEAGIRKYRKAIGIARQFYPAHLRLGLAHISLQDYDKAEGFLNRVLDSEDSVLMAQAYAALAEISQHRYDDKNDKAWLKQGLEYANKALLNDPVNTDAKEILSRLRYDLLVPQEARTALGRIFSNESLQMERRNENAFESATLFSGPGITQSTKQITGYYWKYLTFSSTPLALPVWIYAVFRINAGL